MLIGLDFDNTLIHYGRVFRELAIERGLAPESIAADKGAVRAHVWEWFSDIEWQQLQAAVYGAGIGRGQFMPGAPEFIRLCRTKGVALCVVSHKSEFASIDPGGVSLRRSAMGWMDSQGFFLPVVSGGFGFAVADVYFESRRADKIARINALGCDVFVDDLPEVLEHPDLHSGVRRILFHEREGGGDGYDLVGPWMSIAEYLFGRERA
jgi:hypothetical protein